jgi:hypothetical protein
LFRISKNNNILAKNQTTTKILLNFAANNFKCAPENILKFNIANTYFALRISYIGEEIMGTYWGNDE